jgi:hypothetical protein
MVYHVSIRFAVRYEFRLQVVNKIKLWIAVQFLP